MASWSWPVVFISIVFIDSCTATISYMWLSICWTNHSIQRRPVLQILVLFTPTCFWNTQLLLRQWIFLNSNILTLYNFLAFLWSFRPCFLMCTFSLEGLWPTELLARWECWMNQWFLNLGRCILGYITNRLAERPTTLLSYVLTSITWDISYIFFTKVYLTGISLCCFSLLKWLFCAFLSQSRLI